MPKRTGTPRAEMEVFVISHIPAGAAVIDVGCGRGELTARIAERTPDAAVDGVDWDAPSIRRANRRARRRPNLRYHEGAADELRRIFGPRRFDCAVSSNAFHEFVGPLRTLRVIRSALKPNGLLLIAELTLAAGEAVDDCPRYSRSKIAELVRRAGFRVLAAATRHGANLIRAAKAA